MNDNIIIVKSNSDYEWERTGKKRMPKLLRSALALLLVAAVSVGSCAGYTALFGKDDQPSIQTVVYKAAADGTKIAAAESAIGKYEKPRSIPDIYAECVEYAVLFNCKIPVTNNYFSYFGAMGMPQQPQYQTAYGSGVIMSEDGYVLTNAHVVQDASDIEVVLHDGRKYKATVCGADVNTDVAVVKIEENNLPAAKFGDSSTLLVGEEAYAIGNPLNSDLAFTLTCGHISATEREINIEGTKMSLMQIDAAVSPGNSGGPLINDRGLVVGLVNSKINSTGYEGLGFAIPINTVLSIAKNLIDYGYVASRPMLGITVQSITEQQAMMYGYEPGLTITVVSAGSCSELAGAKVGDKITHFNGVAVNDSAELNFEKGKYKIGDEVTMTVVRDGATIVLNIKLSA